MGVQPAAHFMAAAVALATMSCSLIAPAEYERDAGVEPPPYIVPHTEDPPFESTLQYNVLDAPDYKVTVGDADVNRDLQVRFCLREGADPANKYLLATNPIAAEPTPDHTVERKPIVVKGLEVCNRFAPTNASRFLYVIVAPRTAFVNPENGCDVSPGAGYDYAFWRFTCDEPQ
jgi:hypothetical protein